MEPRFELLPEKKLVGKRVTTSFAVNRTVELWRSFMPVRKEILNAVGAELYSVEVYGPDFFRNFNPEAAFEKWAAMEVTDFDSVPDGMEPLLLTGGLYAVFLHKGSNTDNSTYQFIFGTWLPGSGYLPDDRPHFEILGEKYKNGDPTSEEEIWIPVKPV